MNDPIPKLKEKLIQLLGYDPFQIQNKKQMIENTKIVETFLTFSKTQDVTYFLNFIIYYATTNINDIYKLHLHVNIRYEDVIIIDVLYVLNKHAKSLVYTITKKLENNGIICCHDTPKKKCTIHYYYYEIVGRLKFRTINSKYYDLGIYYFDIAELFVTIDETIEKCRNDCGLVTRRDNCRSSLVFFMLTFGKLKVFPKDIIRTIGQMIYKTKYNKEWDF